MRRAGVVRSRGQAPRLGSWSTPADGLPENLIAEIRAALWRPNAAFLVRSQSSGEEITSLGRDLLLGPAAFHLAVFAANDDHQSLLSGVLF